MKQTNLIRFSQQVDWVKSLMLIALLLLLFRVWMLTVVRNSEEVHQFQTPSTKTIHQPALRGEIVDRFGIPLATNEMSYRLCIVYAQIKEVIPRLVIEKKGLMRGKRIYKRKEYIKNLCQMLSASLGLDAERTEDLIYSYAALYGSSPYVLKPNLTEEEYYKLQFLSQQWPGLICEKVPLRSYPKGRVGSHLLGYIGKINRKEYHDILAQMQSLKDQLKEYDEGIVTSISNECARFEKEQELLALQEKSYTFHDCVGKSGLELQFEQDLRGTVGKELWKVNAQGKFLYPLDGFKEAQPGNTLNISIIAELQEYAEQLLANNEKVREERSFEIDQETRRRTPLKQPWIKGGSIVVMDPQTGQVLALASYPGYDPNDFVPGKQDNSKILDWIESDIDLSKAWFMKKPLTRLYYNYDKQEEELEEIWLGWNSYLNLVLPHQSKVKEQLLGVRSLGQLIDGLKALDGALQVSSKNTIRNLLQEWPSNASSNFEGVDHILQVDHWINKLSTLEDRTLFFDLLGIAADHHLFSSSLRPFLDTYTVEDYFLLSGVFNSFRAKVRAIASQEHYRLCFKPWCDANYRWFLKEKRLEEKARKTYARPYLDYFDKEQNSQFEEFWKKNEWNCITTLLYGPIESHNSDVLNVFEDLHLMASANLVEQDWLDDFITLKDLTQTIPRELLPELLQTVRSFSEYKRPLIGQYGYVTGVGVVRSEKELLQVVRSLTSPGKVRSLAYRAPSALGSLYKIVVAYQALKEKYESLERRVIEYTDLNPLNVVDQVSRQGKRWFVGFDSYGTPIPQIYKGGRIPRSATNSLGQCDILRAIEVSSNLYFSLLAAEHIATPDNLINTSIAFSLGQKTGIELPWERGGSLAEDLAFNKTGLYAFAIGQHVLTTTPLQVAAMFSSFANGGYVLQPTLRADEHSEVKILDEVFIPKEVQSVLWHGMDRAFRRDGVQRAWSLYSLWKGNREIVKGIEKHQGRLIGKSGSAEIRQRVDLDFNRGAPMYRNQWYGGIYFDKPIPQKPIFDTDDYKPELIIVVQTYYGGYGRELIPIVGAIVDKWNEIKENRGSNLNRL